MSKVIRLPNDYFFSAKDHPLTPSMRIRLRKALEMQTEKLPFGQKDINGSFNALLERGLIKSRNITIDGIVTTDWYVTDNGIASLEKKMSVL